MTEVNRKIHVVGINSYKFEDLPFKLQKLFIEILQFPIHILKKLNRGAKIIQKKRNHFFRATVIINLLIGLDLKKMMLF